jgi:hypothetical protein
VTTATRDITPAGAPASPDSKRRWTWQHGLVALVVLGLAGMWIAALFFSDITPRNLLDDKAWAARQQVRCEKVVDRIDEFASAEIIVTMTSPQQRAVLVQRANPIVDQLVADIAADPVTGSERHRAFVSLWLDDYRIYNQSRHDYAEKLAAGQDTAFASRTDAKGKPITDKIDQFARVNNMLSCQVPGDV